MIGNKMFARRSLEDKAKRKSELYLYLRWLMMDNKEKNKRFKNLIDKLFFRRFDYKDILCFLILIILLLCQIYSFYFPFDGDRFIRFISGYITFHLIGYCCFRYGFQTGVEKSYRNYLSHDFQWLGLFVFLQYK